MRKHSNYNKEEQMKSKKKKVDIKKQKEGTEEEYLRPRIKEVQHADDAEVATSSGSAACGEC